MAIILPKSVFFHIPKTGGNWVRQAIGNSGTIPWTIYAPEIEHHLTLQTDHIPPSHMNTEGKFTFTFVRNPLTWYQSFWRYRRMEAKDGQTMWRDAFILDEKCKAETFNKMVVNSIEKFPEGFITSLYQEFVGKDLKKVDFIGKQENLENDFIIALNKAGETFNEEAIRKTAKVNVSNPLWGKECEYDSKVKERVKEIEKWTFEMFGYN